MLEVDEVTARYGELTAVDDVSLTVEDGELFCLLGPSGCGKSTVLRTIAGFEQPASGRVSIRGTDVTDRPPHRRDCSIVFQDWALFPHKSVLENVAFGLKMQGVSTAERQERAREALDLVEIGSQAEAAPAELSGGQKQRVALARSLTVDPDLLLLDEPLSNLDRRLRESMQIELKDIQRRLETTMVYVTHDQNEAFTLADRLGVMNDGELVQVGDPATVYDDPGSRFIESFLGSTNFISCRVVAAEGQPILAAPFGVQFRAPIGGEPLAQGDTVVVSLRPERLRLGPGAEVATTAVEDGGVATDEVSVPCSVVETIRRGSSVRVRLSAEETNLFIEVPVGDGVDMTAGDTVALRWTAEDAVYFAETGERYR
ncbi:ABC transporter ATP-binding protein [Halorientalis sp.]|jgi:spermidine/putrescine transport system ATP-binding protein|uniref:ABC transporter ATP-binding protein n=1 Tax=Halorientalis sp. TaxID=1931229 RepID=UPI002628CC61|nr:ABC transporter ATP-binding protein [Halorientalis sp.]